MADGFLTHQTALTLVGSDRRAQGAACDVSKFAAEGCKGFGPLVTEEHRYWLVVKMAEAPTVKERRSTSGVLKKAKLGVKQHGIRGCVR